MIHPIAIAELIRVKQGYPPLRNPRPRVVLRPAA